MAINATIFLLSVLVGVVTADAYCTYKLSGSSYEQNWCKYGCCGDPPYQTCCPKSNDIRNIWIVIGCVIGLILILLIIFICVCCRIRRKKVVETPKQPEESPALQGHSLSTVIIPMESLSTNYITRPEACSH